MSGANPNPMEKSMVSVLVVANTGGGVPVVVIGYFGQWHRDAQEQETHDVWKRQQELHSNGHRTTQ
jgi:hypothetical protein